MNESIVKMKDILFRLLTPNDILAPHIFDTNGTMHQQIRQQLFDEAYYVVANTIGRIEGFKVRDIFLTGSSASYYYHDSSDLDIRIEAYNKSNPYFTNDAQTLDLFMQAFFLGRLNQYRFKLNERSVDISFSSKTFEIMGLYSIIQNKWIIEPQKKFADKLNPDAIMEEYLQEFYDIRFYIWTMINTGQNKTMKGIEEIKNHHQKIMEKGYTDIHNYIIFKLLNYSGVLNDLRSLFNESLKNFLSLS